MIKVVKFGGSSLADAEHFRQVAAIVKADPNRRFVVPSAPGKRFKEDTKVTDMLYTCYNETLKNGEISERYIHHHAGIPHISERYVKYEPAFRHF